jgi:hypothetical protein
MSFHFVLAAVAAALLAALSATPLLSPLSVRRVVSGGVAVGWVPGTLTRLSLAYDITATDGLSRVREHALMLRVQQAF